MVNKMAMIQIHMGAVPRMLKKSEVLKKMSSDMAEAMILITIEAKRHPQISCFFS